MTPLSKTVLDIGSEQRVPPLRFATVGMTILWVIKKTADPSASLLMTQCRAYGAPMHCWIWYPKPFRARLSLAAGPPGLDAYSGR
jgi:hypothetical protein